jgi:two-component sensor histidine kinase
VAEPTNRLTLNATLLLVVGIALLPFALLSIYQSITVRENLRQMIGDRLIASASQTALEQREPIAMARHILERIAREDHIQKMAPDCSQILKDRVEGRLPIINFTRWDAAGQSICFARPPTPTAVNAEMAWWLEAKRTRQFLMSAQVNARETPQRILLAVQPMTDASGTWQGALTAAIDLSWIEHALADRRLSPRAMVGIADASGKVLASTGSPSFGSIDLHASGRRVAVLSGRNAEAWIYASAPLYDGQLFVFFAEPQQLAFAMSRDHFRYGLLLPLSAILLTCVVLWLSLDRFLLRWLRRAGLHVRQMADGNYNEDHGAFRTAPLELQRLGRDLDDMARSVDRRDQALRSALTAKDAMAREVNHRVKNNLQMITSIVSLQASRLSDPEARRLMTQTRLRVGALALVQRLIYEVDDSEQGVVNTDRLFSELCAEVQANFQSSKVLVSCHSNLGVISGDHAVSAALIVIEAVTNALRHGFPEDQAGTINVLLEPAGEDGLLTICDDGIGSSDDDDPAGMGLELISALTSQLEGWLTLSQTQGGGRTVAVRFPCGEAVPSM